MSKVEITDAMVARGEAAHCCSNPECIRRVLEAALNPPEPCNHRWVPASIDDWEGDFCVRCTARKPAHHEIEVTEAMREAGRRAWESLKSDWARGTDYISGGAGVDILYRAMCAARPENHQAGTVPFKSREVYDEGTRHRRDGDGEAVFDGVQGVRWVPHSHYHRRKDDP